MKPNIAHDDVAHVDVQDDTPNADVQVDTSHADLHLDIAHGIQYIIDNNHEKENPSLKLLYFKLRYMFEGTFVVSSELPPTTIDVAEEKSISFTPCTSIVPQNILVASRKFDAT